MALTLRSSFAVQTGATPLTFDKPTGLVAGDLMLMHIVLNEDVIPTVPGGWQIVPSAAITGHTQSARVFMKIATSGEPDTYAVRWTGTGNGSGQIIAIGAGTPYPEAYLVATDFTDVASANKVFPGVTNTATNTLLLCFGGWTAVNSTPDGAMTERTDSGNPRSYLMTQAVAASGATGTRTATGTSTTFQRLITISVREAGSAPSALTHEDDVTGAPVFVEMTGEGIEITEAAVFAEIGARGVYLSEAPVYAEIGAKGIFVTQAALLLELLFQETTEDTVVPTHFPASAGTRRMHTKLPDEVTGYAFDPEYSWWSTVVAEESTNLIPNPSFEGWNDVGYAMEWDDGGFLTSLDFVEFPIVGATAGRRCAMLTSSGGDSGWIYNGDGIHITPGPYTWSLDVYVTQVPYTLAMLAVDEGSSATLMHRFFTVTSTGWQRLSITYVELGTRDIELRLVLLNTNPNDTVVYTDAWQLEPKKYATTYLDGDMIGFADTAPNQSYFWHGEPHHSKSTRRARTGSGGRIVSWSEEARFRTTSLVGLGMTNVDQVIQTLGDGREVHVGMVDKSRDFTITGRIFAGNHQELLARRNDLIRLLKHNNTVGGDQMILRYQEVDDRQHLIGAPVEITCVYREGMQGNQTNLYQENLPLQFKAVEPFPRDVIESSAELLLFAELSDTGLIFRDEVGEYTHLGSGLTTGGVVSRVGFMRDGSVVAIGNFTQIGGDTVLNDAYWDGENWQQLGTGGPSSVNVIDDGYKLGLPLLAAGVDGEVWHYNDVSHVWTTLGSQGFMLPINAMQRDIDGNVWVGGEFEYAADTTTPFFHVAKWSAETEDWEPIAGGLDDPADLTDDPTSVYAVLVPGDGSVYFGGDFTVANENFDPSPPIVVTKSVARWDIATSTWHAMGTGLGDTVKHLLRGPDGYIYAVGEFSTDAALMPFRYPVRGFARFNGSLWEEVFPLVNQEGIYGADGVIIDNEGIFWFWNYVSDPDTDLFVVPGIGEVGMFGWRDGIFYPPYLPLSGMMDVAIGPGGRTMHQTHAFTGESTQPVPAVNHIEYAGTADAPVHIHLHGPGQFIHLLNLSTEGGVYGKDTFTLSETEEVIFRTDSQRVMSYSNQRHTLASQISVGPSRMKSLRLRPGLNRVSVLCIDIDEDESYGWLGWKNRFVSLQEGAR